MRVPAARGAYDQEIVEGKLINHDSRGPRGAPRVSVASLPPRSRRRPVLSAGRRQLFAFLEPTR